MPTRRVIDNGAYEAWLVKVGQDYSGKTWGAWVAAAEARAVPGAVEFTKYADSKGVKVFYVTNRTADQEEATRKNMEALGFPMGGNVDTFLMAKEKDDWTSKKGTRRAFVAKDYRVLLLFGDNYGDFSDDYGKSEADRLEVARGQHGACRPRLDLHRQPRIRLVRVGAVLQRLQEVARRAAQDEDRRAADVEGAGRIGPASGAKARAGPSRLGASARLLRRRRRRGRRSETPPRRSGCGRCCASRPDPSPAASGSRAWRSPRS